MSDTIAKAGDDKVIDKQIDESIEEIEAEIAAGKGRDKAAASKAVKPKTSKLGFYLLMLLLFVAAIIGGLTLTGQLRPFYDAFTGDVGSTVAVKAEVTERAEVPQSQPDPIVRSPQTKKLAQQPTSVAENQAVAIVPADITRNKLAIDQALERQASNQLNDLLISMESLRTVLGSLEESQKALKSSLTEQQRVNLQARLRWIADPDSRLPQMQLAWEEIALLPGLTEQQLQQAADMHALARTNVQRLKRWKGNLHKWADALTTPIHKNILPQPEHPWLAWIVGQFQLRQAPSDEARHLADLRGRLLDASRQLTLELWPHQGPWQSLHAELLLQVKAMQDRDADLKVEMGLPADFTAVQNDITALRQTALQWADEVQQGDVEGGEVQQEGML